MLAQEARRSGPVLILLPMARDEGRHTAAAAGRIPRLAHAPRLGPGQAAAAAPQFRVEGDLGLRTHPLPQPTLWGTALVGAVITSGRGSVASVAVSYYLSTIRSASIVGVAGGDRAGPHPDLRRAAESSSPAPNFSRPSPPVPPTHTR